MSTCITKAWTSCSLVSKFSLLEFFYWGQFFVFILLNACTCYHKLLMADPMKKDQLDSTKRFKIIEGIAQGLLYLHKYSRLRIVHRDLKASNILLDAEMNPKISDFGMARIFGQDESEANTKRIVGT